MSWMSSQPEPSDPVVIGRVLRPHGLVGEVIVDPTDSRTVHFEPGTCLWMAGSWREVIRCRAQGDRWIVRLGGVADRDEAGTLRDEEISVEAAGLPDLGSGCYYIHDLVGCRVENPTGVKLGEIVAVVPGPQDWLEIAQHGERSLVPMVGALLKEVNVEARLVVIDPPAGLVEATKA